MAIIVQKFGGTSVADAQKIRHAASRVIKAVKNGYKVVVVASARGKPVSYTHLTLPTTPYV